MDPSKFGAAGVPPGAEDFARTMNRIATIVKGYPRLSETFIAQEILGLEKRGIAQLIVSLRHPTEGKVHDLNREIAADVLYLPEYLKDDPRRVRAGRKWAETQPGFRRAEKAFVADLKRDGSVNRRRRFGQACVLAHELPADVDWIHTHYLHTPGVGRALCSDDPRARLVVLRAREGHLDDAEMGAERKARGRGVGCDLYAREPRLSALAHRDTAEDRSCLSRSRFLTVSSAAEADGG